MLTNVNQTLAKVHQCWQLLKHVIKTIWKDDNQIYSENVEIGAVQKCAKSVDLKQCVKISTSTYEYIVFCCKNRLRYSRDRALQSYILYFSHPKVLMHKIL